MVELQQRCCTQSGTRRAERYPMTNHKNIGQEEASLITEYNPLHSQIIVSPRNSQKAQLRSPSARSCTCTPAREPGWWARGKGMGLEEVVAVSGPGIGAGSLPTAGSPQQTAGWVVPSHRL